ncbi:MAG: serine protein kinase, partial [Planctomycetota bacterium]
MTDANEILSVVDKHVNPDRFRDQHWEGTFQDYLAIVLRNPNVARNAFQRIYDMIMHFGYERYTHLREEMIRYKFFSDPIDNGKDAIFGLDKPLMNLVDFFKSAAHQYGTERRILLLHGPVGSSKSTIARLLKKGLEYYSRLEEGALYTFSWEIPDENGRIVSHPCPMHEEPLKLIPIEAREDVLARINEELPEGRRIHVEGALDPFCRRMFEDLLVRHDGDWRKVVEHVKVRRLILSERDRVGIGTFQPKDEKNQDST